MDNQLTAKTLKFTSAKNLYVYGIGKQDYMRRLFERNNVLKFIKS